MPLVSDFSVRQNAPVAPGHYRMRIDAPELAQAARPGQFAMLQVSQGLYPFLRRPMSFERIYEDGLTFLYKVEGEGTRLLAALQPGQQINVQGPLGNGFTVSTRFSRHILVAGGIGVAPFPALAEAIIAACGTAPEVIIAARTREYLLCAEDFEAMGCTVHLATDDGSRGDKAFASQVLEALAPDPAGTRVYACGPMPMMRATTKVTLALGLDCQVSLEAQMACGDGACLGCVVESKREREGERMVRVCCDGPVFNTNDIDWEAHNLVYDP
jgi:dihydroorotate dehydrogenase electron transfer subunit